MTEIGINEVWDPEHSRALDKDNYNVSRTCDDTINNMHHIHNSCEFLLVEKGSAFYYIDNVEYHAEAGDLLVIEAMHHHQRVIETLPFQRYGLTVKPSYLKSLLLEDELSHVLKTPSVEAYKRHYKSISKRTFGYFVVLLQALNAEQKNLYSSYRSVLERSIIAQIIVILFREFELKPSSTPLTPAHVRMLDIKEYIDLHYYERLDLKIISEKFFLHPATVSKDFHKHCGHSFNKYINMVRVSEAAKRLENTYDSIELIAEKCGYDSTNTLLRQFKKILELSPSQYRKEFLEIYRKTYTSSPKK